MEGATLPSYCQNAFRFKTDKKYNLIWSAGLFDYLDEKQFIFLFRALTKLLKPEGELVVGNFSESNTSKDYMEFGEWYLNHRTENELIRLAEQSGCVSKSISIDRETSGVNLFIKHRNC